MRAARPDLGALHVSCGPERVLPGNLLAEFRRNPRLAGGTSAEATLRAVAFHRGFVEGEVTGTDAASAEMAKLVENSSRDVNIAVANEAAPSRGITGWTSSRWSNLRTATRASMCCGPAPAWAGIASRWTRGSSPRARRNRRG